MTEKQIEVVDAMAQYGGSFVKALAECYYKADAINFNKLQDTFSEYWDEYDELIHKK